MPEISLPTKGAQDEILERVRNLSVIYAGLRKRMFNVGTHTFTVPEGVTQVFITGTGAGGGGTGYGSSSYHNAGASGGITSFGGYLSLSGGGGGAVSSTVSGTGSGGSNNGVTGIISGNRGGTASTFVIPSFGVGGSGFAKGGRGAGENGQWGAGGAGIGPSTQGSNMCPGGGSGAYTFGFPVNVNPGEEIAVVVGAGGNGGASLNGAKGGNGGDGVLIVEWYESN